MAADSQNALSINSRAFLFSRFTLRRLTKREINQQADGQPACGARGYPYVHKNKSPTSPVNRLYRPSRNGRPSRNRRSRIVNKFANKM